MTAVLRAEESRNASNRHISSIISPDKRVVTTKTGICEAFLYYFQALFTREPSLNRIQFDAYLTDFPRLEAAETAKSKCTITGSEICETLKLFGRVKLRDLDGLPYDLYLRQSCVFFLT